MTKPVEATQADRDAAVSWARIHLNWTARYRDAVKRGEEDTNWLVLALAYHRQEATRELVEEVRRATIEECARVAESKVANADDWDSSYWDQACQSVVYSIRQLERERGK